jgi:hypothetical protein
MKTIVAIKLFLVLCCQTSTNDKEYSYEVHELNNTENTGIIYSRVKHNPGDTIRIAIPTIEITSNK